MAIDPSILLRGRLPDTGATIRGALQNVGSIRNLQNTAEDRQRKVEANEFLTNILPFVQTQDISGALSAVQRSQVLDDDDKAATTRALEALQAGNPKPLEALTTGSNRLVGITGAGDLQKQRLDLDERKLAEQVKVREQREEIFFAGADEAGKKKRKQLEAELDIKPSVTTAVEKAKTDVASSARVINKSFERISSIRSNMINLDRAIGALDRGAKTGAITQFVPSITKASRELQQIQRELGLDVVGAVTFGALSKGELDLALGTALDLGQEPEALKEILIAKKVAQEKLMGYLNQQVQFLDAGGTVAGWLQQNDRSRATEIQSLREAAGI